MKTYFYYETRDGEVVIVHTQECKKPERTKIWANLQSMASETDCVSSIGWKFEF